MSKNVFPLIFFSILFFPFLSLYLSLFSIPQSLFHNILSSSNILSTDHSIYSLILLSFIPIIHVITLFFIPAIISIDDPISVIFDSLHWFYWSNTITLYFYSLMSHWSLSVLYYYLHSIKIASLNISIPPLSLHSPFITSVFIPSISDSLFCIFHFPSLTLVSNYSVVIVNGSIYHIESIYPISK